MATASINTAVKTIELFASAFDRGARDRLDALEAVTVTGSGLATGGGDLTAARVITVAKASGAEAVAGTDDAKAVTPLALASALNPILTALDGIAPVPSLVARVVERPGDCPALYGTSKTGAPASLSAVDADWVAVSSAGRVLRVNGATASDPQVIAPLAAFPIEAGVIYTIRYKVQRQTDPIDPLNDSVSLGVRWLDKDKAGIAGVNGSITVDNVALAVSDGVQERSARIALTDSPYIDFYPVSGAVYFRPYVEMFGSQHVTDVIVIEVQKSATSVVIAGSLIIQVMEHDPPDGPGAGKVALYAYKNTDGTANLKMQAGTDSAAYDIIVNVGGGV